MDNMCTYQVTVKGEIDARDLSISSPQEMVFVSATATATSFTIRTDQSGLIGILRYLHGRGFVFLSIFRRKSRC